MAIKPITTVGELLKILDEFNEQDLIVMETIDLESGDTQDLYPFYVDAIDGIKLLNGETVKEIRICQMNNI